MPGAFDQIAEEYDAGFVDTAVGKMQRDVVWKYLEKTFEKKRNLRILELNCGTGEDAVWLASQGHQVLATDVSEKMLDVARSKGSGLTENISFALLDISQAESYPSDTTFDLVFSNFGGLNCVSPEILQAIAPNLASLLNPGGRLIAVVMSGFCLWETFYFGIKGRPKEAFRRSRNSSVKVKIGDELVETWYYSTSKLKRIFGDAFKVVDKQAVGLFIPPSYLDNYFRNHKKSLQSLQRLENSTARLSVTANLSDHFLIDMEVKK